MGILGSKIERVSIRTDRGKMPQDRKDRYDSRWENESGSRREGSSPRVCDIDKAEVGR